MTEQEAQKWLERFVCKTEDDLCSLGVASRVEAREHIKVMARQLKGKV